ncbi:MAG: tRNA (adenosine(37)-N6)-threonylcarbamoyltransferase complex dimerization subunit type 1 TsaB [Trichlorobacter sp.]|uniref:tRNA (adenosine(37)-N6)-threonylcarbamoyltransferase complex dimerization subunit type 1 TsaB n=1 Tax=Trichlorobacter sp. TaxID=2911007 RepID=UPI00256D8FFF|nr:tRNA (adenosine(37)-N6)-threonylcarbamoyltransferase complex dimerization subunit type 1 TsaB [Trichlorobacter sp.]MDK9718919.1 tRNA (adenosine(37)-N6)-threonylcarbamoyltransferase complex dimerization subunit type 1 TsaB [Trichlorobacter sp.]
MICLCIETATARVGMALTRDGRLLAESLLDAPGGQQNKLLMPELQRLLDQNRLTINQVDLFACAVGPGSFTGVRTGIAATQGLALAAGKPCSGISTLAMLAMNLPHAAFQVCPMLDARKNEVYTGLYRTTGRTTQLKEDCVIHPADFLRMISGPTIFVGDGALRYQEMIQQMLGTDAFFAPQTHHVLRPSSGCLLAETAFQNGSSVPPEQLLPSYLRLSEAELSRQQKI